MVVQRRLHADKIHLLRQIQALVGQGFTITCKSIGIFLVLYLPQLMKLLRVFLRFGVATLCDTGKQRSQRLSLTLPQSGKFCSWYPAEAAAFAGFAQAARSVPASAA